MRERRSEFVLALPPGRGSEESMSCMQKNFSNQKRFACQEAE